LDAEALKIVDGAGPRPFPSTIPPSSGPHEKRRRRKRAEWQVTNEFVHDGFYYRIIRRPQAVADDVHLTAREEEALAHAALGLSNKEIAKQLGVAASTIGVLLFRAAAKFRVKTRAELLSAYQHSKSEAL
jgi:DNA-binding CsgD family transcriptional regulator